MNLPNIQGNVITTAQVQQFTVVQGIISRLLGQNTSAEFFAKSLFFISVGSSDIFDHYRYSETTLSHPELMTAIQSKYRAQLTVDVDSILLLLASGRFLLV